MLANLLVLALSLSYASAEFDSSNGLQFGLGFVKGLEKDSTKPDACATDLNTVATHLDDLVADVIKVFGGDSLALYEVYTRAKELLANLKTAGGDCDVAALNKNIDEIFSIEGATAFFWRYMENKEAINKEVVSIKKCSADYSACGEACGKIFSILLEWNA